MNSNVAVNAYAKVEAESSLHAADPHKLISMLFQGALLAIANGKNAILRNDFPLKGKAISHATRIIGEGLRESLDKNQGGQLALDLDALYAYMCFRLVEANLKNDTGILDEITHLLSEIKDAWNSIRPTNTAPLSVIPEPPVPIKKQPALVYGRV